MILKKHNIIIRKAIYSDAQKLSEFIKNLDDENEFLLYDKNERKNNTETASRYLAKINENIPSVVFVAINKNKDVIGFVCGEVNNLRRFSHVMKLNIGVLKAYNIGLGRILANTIIEHAKQNSIIRIEASVIAKNQISLNLCKKAGLGIDGIKKFAIKVNDKYYDEIMLSKILSDI